MSAVSATYFRFSGLEVASAPLENDDVDGREVVARDGGGVPGGVVDSAVGRVISQLTKEHTHVWQAQSELEGATRAWALYSVPEEAWRSARAGNIVGSSKAGAPAQMLSGTRSTQQVEAARPPNGNIHDALRKAYAASRPTNSPREPRVQSRLQYKLVPDQNHDNGTV